MSARLNKIKREIPRIISGTTSGIIMKATIGALPGIRYRVTALAANRPKIVLRIATTNPILMLFIKAFNMLGLLIIAAYHFNVNPFNGNAMYFELLKENSGKNKTGR